MSDNIRNENARRFRAATKRWLYVGAIVLDSAGTRVEVVAMRGQLVNIRREITHDDQRNVHFTSLRNVPDVQEKDATSSLRG